MVLFRFSLQDSQERAEFFEKTFFLANIYMKVVLKMPLLSFSNSDCEFDAKTLTRNSYTIAETFLIDKKMELIKKYKFF